MKILMVCLGNICRSPLAEGIMKDKIRAAKLNWTVDSAGIGGWHAGELPDNRSIKIAKKYGIDITDQRARKIQKADFETFNWIFVMDKNNLSEAQNFAKTDEQRDKVQLILNFADATDFGIVPDPYYDNRFELVYELLDSACDKVLERL